MFDFILKINEKEDPILTERLTDLCLTDESGMCDDELTLNFFYDSKFVLPKHDESISISFGVDKDLIEWKSYKVTQIEIKDSTLSLRAYASAGIPSLKVSQMVKWEQTIASIVKKIALKAGCECVVDARFERENIKIVQDESDLSFLHRLARKYNAVLKINDKRIVFVARSYKGLARFKLDKGYPWRWQKAKKVTGVKAFYCDTGLEFSKKKRDHVLVGEDDTVECLPSTYSSKEQAKARASARLEELRIQNETLHLTISCSTEFNTAKIASGCEFEVGNLSEFANGLWSVKRVEHRMNTHQGLEAEIELFRA